MGLTRCGSLLFCLETLAKPLTGSILQLGRQDIYFDYPTFQAHTKELGVTLKPVAQITKRKNPYFPEIDTIDDECFFKSFGFDTVHSIDQSDFENATHIHDLNHPVPAELHNRYDVIFDGGTLEHIFHVPNVLANMHMMLKEGGKLIHYVPVYNFVDHGFYNFSPCLFYDYYQANHYQVHSAYLVCHKAQGSHFVDPLLIKYTPGDLDKYAIGGLNREVLNGHDMMSIFISIEKTRESSCNVIPQQGYYQKTWSAAR